MRRCSLLFYNSPNFNSGAVCTRKVHEKIVYVPCIFLLKSHKFRRKKDGVYSLKVIECMHVDALLRLSKLLRTVNNRGIKHDFPFINNCKVPRDVLKNEGEAPGFQPSRGTLRMLINDKIMFDRYYCINSANHCENEENFGALYFITSSHFPTRVRFYKPCMIRAQFIYSLF